MTTPVLQLALSGPLTNQLVDRLEATITGAPPETREVTVDAAGVTELDPVAAARLWLFCDRSEHLGRRRVRIERLSTALVRRLTRHPLRHHLIPDEAIFGDPFASLLPSER